MARLERERIQNQYILMGSLAIIVLVLALVGYGLLDQFVLKPNRTVLIVGPDKVSLTRFQDQARLTRMNLVNQYNQTAQYATFFGSDPNTLAYFQQSMAQIEAQLDSNAVGQNALQALIEDRLIRQEAARRGITVTKEEVDQAMKEAFGYFPDGTPTPVPTYPVQPTSTLSPLQMTLVPPTATPTSIPVTVTQAAPEFTPTPTLEPQPTPTSAPEPTATPYTEQAFNEQKTTYLADLKSNADLSEETLRWAYEGMLYRQKVIDVVLADLAKTQEKVWARHILIADEATARQALARVKAGEDFATVALELSEDTASKELGGDLDWFGKGQMVAEFEAAAFSLKEGEISELVLSSFGYHIIQVLGHEDRPLSESEFQDLQSSEFQKWLDEQRSATNVEIIDIWRNAVPTKPVLQTQNTAPVQ